MLYLFDIDGTLIRSKGVGREATRAAMLEVFGTSAGIETHKFGGKTDWYTLAELLREHGYNSHEIGRRMPEYEKVLARHMTTLMCEGAVTPCPGAMDVVNTLRHRADSLLGIVTGNTSTCAPIKLRAAGFDPAWFPVGAYGSEALERDDLPPLALKRAIEYDKRSLAPQQVVVIGDTPADVQCGRALGARVVAVCTGFATRDELERAQPDYLLDDLTTLLDVVD
jgi:phosphoglycolate phosphatase